METFIQVAEVWIPQDGELGLRSGIYGRHERFGTLSAATRFAFGEGLPGGVWSSQKPQVWDDLSRSHFVRLSEARRAGLDAGIGIPISAGGRDTNAVLVMLCGSRERLGGCIERWDVYPDTGDLRFAGGFYGNLKQLADVSPRLHFQPGHGLPGLALKRGLPTIESDTRQSGAFLRAQVAREHGIEAGIAIPIYRDGAVAHVVCMLSTESTPLARAFEVFVPSRGDQLKLDHAFYAKGLEQFAEESKGQRFKMGKGLAGRAFQTELPQVLGNLDSDVFARRAAAVAAGLTTGVAIPVVNGPRVIAVVTMLS